MLHESARGAAAAEVPAELNLKVEIDLKLVDHPAILFIRVRIKELVLETWKMADRAVTAASK